MPELSTQQVKAFARLTRLKLSEDEVERMRGQLSAVLTHFQSLARVDTTGVDPTGHTTDANSVVRPDIAGPSLTRDAVLANAPDTEGEFIRVRPILE